MPPMLSSTDPVPTDPAELFQMQPFKLRELRLALGLTQAQMAEELGMHRNTVACMERGEKPISRRTERTVLLLASR